MSDSGSDIELKSALSKKRVKLPRSPSDDVISNNTKKTTTKIMIKDALTELKSRKGVSFYAIKKHLTEKFNVDTVKLNYIIKKSLKTGVEDGSFVQLKGLGASGSFKLANVKEKPKKPEKKKAPEKTEKESKKKPEKTKKAMEKLADKKFKMKTKETVEGKQKEKIGEEKKSKKKGEIKVAKKTKDGDKAEVKGKKMKLKTPSKKKGMMKRKSVGSIIKRPKMKPTHLKTNLE